MHPGSSRPVPGDECFRTSAAWEKWDSRNRAFSCAVSATGGILLIANYGKKRTGKERMNWEKNGKRAGRLARRLALIASIAAVTAGAIATQSPGGVALANAAAAVPAPMITLGIHDGAVNACDSNGTRVTPPTPAELAAATSSFHSKYWRALNVHTVRFSPPWDIAYHHDKTAKANAELSVIQDCLDAWLVGAARAAATVEIAFKPDPNFKSPDGAFVGVPDIATYTAAIKAFISEYSAPANTGGRARVRIIAPWGEPDTPGSGNGRIFMPAGGHLFSDPSCHGSDTDRTCGPVLAAHMWVVVHAACGAACTLPGQTPGSGVIGGDFSGNGGQLVTYLGVYHKNLDGLRPVVWALHPYGDIMKFESTGRPALSGTLTASFARALDTFGYHQHTQIWLDEISAFQYYSQSGKSQPAWTPEVQAAAGQYLLTQLPKAAGGPGEPVVTRAYYLNFQADGQPKTHPNSRWALVLGGGTQPQPIYSTFVSR
jgi:hypothetical protein